MEHNTNTPQTPSSNELELAMGLSPEERARLQEMQERADQAVAKSTEAVLGGYAVDSSGNVLLPSEKEDATSDSRDRERVGRY